MTTLYIIAIACILIELLFVLQIFGHYRYVLKKISKQRVSYRPKAALIVPCKGIDTAFDKNIASFFQLDYDNYEIIFVTESREDEAYSRLLAIKDKFQNQSKAFNIRVLVAGVAGQSSQKLHNLLYACRNVQKDVKVFAFADSDACISKNWLSHIVYPLRKDKHGLASGYRWYIPLKNNLATLALSAMNAKVAQLLGPTIFNCAWGGSMAVRVDVFEKLGIAEIWRTAISDDLTLTRAVKKAKLKVVYVPACLVASFEQTNWRSLFEFVRRQFLITRVTMPGTWWFGLFSSVFSVFGFVGFLILAIISLYGLLNGWQIFLTTSIVFLAGQLTRALLRQKMCLKIFAAQALKLKIAAWADILGSPVWSLMLLLCIISSSFGRTIEWRGIRYKLINPTQAVRF